jgi:hypothetical protein
MGQTGSRRRVFWSLAALLLVGLLAQACSDNKGPAGPTFPAAQTGHADTPDQIVVQVAINPNTVSFNRPVGVTVVVTNTNGRFLPGKRVQMSTSLGTLDPVDGFTNSGGQFVTFLRVTPQNVVQAGTNTATVTAFVEGAVGTGTANFVGPVTLTIFPSTVTRNFAATGASPGTCTIAAGAVSVQFTGIGGTPPYTFAAAGGIGGTISSGGLYTSGAFSIPGGSQLSDSVTVIDSSGQTQTASATIIVSCVAVTTGP